MPLIETKGAASAQGFGEFAASSGAVNYIEDVFSTYLYTGNGSTQTITNGIDLAGKGGLVWMKDRVNGTLWHQLFNTVSGGQYSLASNATDIQYNLGGYPTRGVQFNSNGFSFIDTYNVGVNGDAGVSWTFRKQPKFFDVVTYTGDGNNPKVLSHSLGSTPACMIVKSTSAADNWYVYHTSLGATKYINLDTTSAAATNAGPWNDTAPTSTQFTIGSWLNQVGVTYVVYLYASNAGGFGLTGTDDVISCGSVTNPAGSQFHNVSLGWEPQWLLVKNATGTSTTYWQIVDNMRGLTNNSPNAVCNTLRANATTIESNPGNLQINATGFSYYGGSYNNGDTLIYIAIRRGPMKVPTTGTSVFKPNATSAAAGTVVTTNFPVDLEIGNFLDNYDNKPFTDRLRGYATSTSSRTGAPFLNSVNALGELTTGAPFSYNWWNKSVIIGNYISEYRQVSYYFGRSPNFFDVVCYEGTGVARNISHNLTVVPELIIVKLRTVSSAPWMVYSSSLGSSKYANLNNDIAFDTNSTVWGSMSSTTFGVGINGNVNTASSSYLYVAYLFATCAGVSKVGTYTGTGALQTVNCGFTSGARFILIKRTDSTGDWYVYDSARGITSGNDPYLFLNTNGAEVAGTNYVDTDSTGFKVTASAPAGLNASGGTYLFLAIA